MNSKEQWDKFLKSGKLSDYMMYKASLSGSASVSKPASASTAEPAKDKEKDMPKDGQYTG